MTCIQYIDQAVGALCPRGESFAPKDVIAWIARRHGGETVNPGTVRAQITLYCVNAHPSHDGYTDRGRYWKARPLFVKVSRGEFRRFDPKSDRVLYMREVQRDGMPGVPPPTPSRTSGATARYVVPTVRRVPDLFRTVRQFHLKLRRDPQHRYHSWEHCYGHFRGLRAKSVVTASDIDLAALQLGFYLASWGMYRGASFLLQKDYRVHCDAVRVLLKPVYAPLWAGDECTLPPAAVGHRADLVMVLYQELKVTYGNVTYVRPPSRKSPRPAIKQASPSDVLITKVMLGTAGCIPAYDRFFKRGLARTGGAVQKLGTKSITQLLAFAQANARTLGRLGSSAAKKRPLYPPMKLIDTYFWQKGL